MSMNSLKTLVIGSSVCDVIINVHRIPQVAEDENIIKQVLSIGGCAYNVASMLRFYKQPYSLFSPIGTGIYGDFVKQEFQKRNISIMIETQRRNGCCYCLVDDSGERTFICEHGAEYFFDKEWFEQLHADEYEQVYVCGLEIEETTGDVIIDFLEKHMNLQIYFAPGPRIHYIDSQKLKRLFQLHPILHLNLDEILAYTKESSLYNAAKQLYQCTQNIVIVTLGEDGCYYYDGNEHYVDGYQVNVINTVGAGDCHIGTIIAQRSLKKSWQESLKEANKMASLIVSRETSNM